MHEHSLGMRNDRGGDGEELTDPQSEGDSRGTMQSFKKWGLIYYERQ